MRLYVDDDLDSNLLIRVLEGAGHEIISPRAVETRGAADEGHLHYAADRGLVLLTANAGDFLALHHEWMRQRRQHAGLLLVYRENNPARDMTFQQIAQAVTGLEAAGLPLANTFQNLNYWRGSSGEGRS